MYPSSWGQKLSVGEVLARKPVSIHGLLQQAVKMCHNPRYFVPTFPFLYVLNKKNANFDLVQQV